MSCPNWDDLARRRSTARREPAAWRQAIRHLDGCRSCRRQALESDSLLVFRLRSEASRKPLDEAAAAAEVDAMCRSVRAVVHSRQWESPRRRSRPSQAWRQAAAVGLLAFLLLVLGPGERAGSLPSAGLPDSSLALVEVDRSAGSTTDDELLDILTEALPVSLVEDVDRPGARVYEMRRDNLSLVMIVDRSFDV